MNKSKPSVEVLLCVKFCINMFFLQLLMSSDIGITHSHWTFLLLSTSNCNILKMFYIGSSISRPLLLPKMIIISVSDLQLASFSRSFFFIILHYYFLTLTRQSILSLNQPSQLWFLLGCYISYLLTLLYKNITTNLVA